MSQRILVEFNTDYVSKWPDAVQDIIREIAHDNEAIRRWEMYGITKKWHRHHSERCPVETYKEEL